MSRHFIRYLIFWLPALAAGYLIPAHTPAGQAAQWFLGFFMLFGWAACTGMLAYSRPRGALCLLLVYFGACALLINGLVRAQFGTPVYALLDHAAGALTYRPLNMLYQTLLDFAVFREMWLLGIITAFCAAGLICGAIYRQVNPNPYRPRFARVSD